MLSMVRWPLRWPRSHQPLRPNKDAEAGMRTFFMRATISIRLASCLLRRISAALNAPGRTEGVRKIAARFGVDPSTVRRISLPFAEAAGA
jgi:hypothetical protein